MATKSRIRAVEAREVQVEPGVAEQPSLRVERLRKLMSALELVTGSYLESSDLAWAEGRRYQLDVIHGEVMLEAADLLVESGTEERARELCERVLEQDPCSEAAYRLLTRIEQAIGTPTSSMAVYRRAVAALKELVLEPDGEMRRLMRSVDR